MQTEPFFVGSEGVGHWRSPVERGSRTGEGAESPERDLWLQKVWKKRGCFSTLWNPKTMKNEGFTGFTPPKYGL